MLNQIYQSEPWKYHTRASFAAAGGKYAGNAYYGTYIPPWNESMTALKNMFVHPTETLKSYNSVYVLAQLSTEYWPSWGASLQRWDSSTGQWLQRMPIGVSVVGTMTLQNMFRSRVGKMYYTGILTDGLIEFTLTESGDIAAIAGGAHISASKFGMYQFFGYIGIDDTPEPHGNKLLSADGTDLSVFNLTTGQLLYKRRFPAPIVGIALEEDDRVYVLLNNRILALFDYTRNDVMGASKIPTTAKNEGIAEGQIVMSWDWLLRRLLIMERVPDVQGASQTKIKGYRAVPIPVRITIPIPLRVPRRDRVIPVMSQVVGDMNEGVGGYNVTVTVSGDAALAGMPTTDGLGVAVTKVRCGLPSNLVIGGPGSDEVGVEELVYTDIDAGGMTPDVGYYEGSLYLAYETFDHFLRVLRDGTELYKTGLITTPEPGGGFTPLTVPAGSFPRVVGKSCAFRNGTSAILWDNMDQGPMTWETLDKSASGNHPTALSPTTVGWQTGPGFLVKLKNRATKDIKQAGLSTIEGLSRLTETGFVLMEAEAERKDKNGLVWGKKPSFASSLIVCEGLSGGVVLRMDDEPATEIVLWEGEPCFEPRVAVHGQEVTVVCWGGTGVRQAQFPTSDIPQFAPGDAGDWGTGETGGGLGTDPIAPVIGRDILFGYFLQYGLQYGDNPNAPSNVVLSGELRDNTIALAAGKKLMVSGAGITAAVGNEDEVACIYIEDGTIAGLEEQAAAHRGGLIPPSLMDKPICGTFDGGQTLPTDVPDGVEWLGLECYTGINETAQQCEDRVQACIDNLLLLNPDLKFLLIGQSYTSNANNTSNAQVLIDTQYIPANLAIANPEVEAILMFSDGRPTGTRDHEQWRPIHQAIFDGIGAGGTGTSVGSIAAPPGTFKIVTGVTTILKPIGGAVPTATSGSGTTPGTGTTPPKPPPGGAPVECTASRPPITAYDDVTLTDLAERSLQWLDETAQIPSGAEDDVDVPYWVAKANKWEKFPDGICRIGWSKYWERSMAGELPPVAYADLQAEGPVAVP
jgi:hypothetical protein